MEKSLENKVALVSGGSRGIGKAIVEILAENGATVIINYSGSKQKAEELAASLEAKGCQAEAVGCDVSDFEETEKMVKYVCDKYGKVDILVNNAGITRDNLVMRMSEQEFDQVIATNLKGAFNLIRHLSRNFLKLRYGKIINISSVSGVMGNAGQANYAASKAGVIGLTKSVARELASRNISVNAVAPGFIQTDMTDSLPASVLEGAQKSIPAGRLGTAEEVAKLVLFLAGSGSDYITGQVIGIDGGLAM